MTPLKTLPVLLLLAGLVAGLGEFYGRVEFDGACPFSRTVAMEKFNVRRFMHLWHVFKMYIDTPLLKCISEEYSNPNQGTFNITRRGVRIRDNRIVEKKALAIPVSNLRSGRRIRASFHISTAGSAVGTDSDFDVGATDYKNYAIVMSCIPSPTPGKSLRSLVLLTSDRRPKLWVKQKMYDLLRDTFQLSLTELKKIDQRSC